jgi:hypothetical protein
VGDEKMTLQKVEAWVNRLPALDRDLPIITHEGKTWTPNEILNQIRSCPTCQTSLALQAFIEARSFGQEANPWELAKQRIIKMFQLRPALIHTYILGAPATLTPETVIKHIQEETPLGQSLINAEMQRMMLLIHQQG